MALAGCACKPPTACDTAEPPARHRPSGIVIFDKDHMLWLTGRGLVKLDGLSLADITRYVINSLKPMY